VSTRRVVWFSCGAASGVLARIATETYDDITVVYCDTMRDEHPDNMRFYEDVERWIGQPIETIASDRFASIDDVFAKRRYLSGIAGAPCTVAMKKMPRFAFEQPGDVHLFGFTADEPDRIERFNQNNPDLDAEHLLADRGITKADCYQIIEEAGIAMPAMYLLGYSNNNCLGCVKASSGTYWNMIRRDFPDVFAKRARQSREYGARLVNVRGERWFLDELPADYWPTVVENISCGPDCGTQLRIVEDTP